MKKLLILFLIPAMCFVGCKRKAKIAAHPPVNMIINGEYQLYGVSDSAYGVYGITDKKLNK